MFFECDLCVSELERIKQTFDDDVCAVEAYFPVRDVIAQWYGSEARVSVTGAARALLVDLRDFRAIDGKGYGNGKQKDRERRKG